MTMTGAGMLWVGWFGFNGGWALAANARPASAIVATHLAASAGADLDCHRKDQGRQGDLGRAGDRLRGRARDGNAGRRLRHQPRPSPSAGRRLVCFFAAVTVKQRLRIDNSLDVFAVHGIGGMLGSLQLSVFAAAALGGVGFAEGMNFPRQLGAQLLAIAVAAAWSAGVTFVLVCLLRPVTGLRVDAEREFDGLDFTTHGERAYDYAG